MEEKRARRRRDLARMKARARRVFGQYDYFTNNWAKSTGRPEDVIDQARYEKYANHIKVCSCAGCGNPRRHKWTDNPLTMQERRFAAEDASE